MRLTIMFALSVAVGFIAGACYPDNIRSPEPDWTIVYAGGHDAGRE